GHATIPFVLNETGWDCGYRAWMRVRRRRADADAPFAREFRRACVTVMALLEPGAHGRDALRVETEPGHPAHVARMLNLETKVHDHCHATVLGDLRALLVDHAELAPEGTGVDRHSFPCYPRQGIRRAEDVHDVHRHGYVRQARVARLSENLRLAGIHRNHTVAVPLEVVANEVAGPQLVGRQAHDRDRPGRVEHALDRQRVLVPPEVSHAVATFFLLSRRPARDPAPDPRSGPRRTRC